MAATPIEHTESQHCGLINRGVETDVCPVTSHFVIVIALTVVIVCARGSR